MQMIRRSKHLNFKLMRYKFWQPLKIQKQLVKSFVNNFWIKPKLRLSFIIQKQFFNRQHRFYKSQNKLQCFSNYSFSVPNKKLGNSRFFLNKGLDRLMYGGYQK